MIKIEECSIKDRDISFNPSEYRLFININYKKCFCNNEKCRGFELRYISFNLQFLAKLNEIERACIIHKNLEF